MPIPKSGKVIKCDYCGKNHYKKPYLVRKNKHHFCSNECFYKWMGIHRKKEGHPGWKGGNRNKICDYCGKLHSITPYRVRKYKHHFCSRECQLKWQQKNGKNGTRKASVCETCGKELYLPPYKLKYQHHFCSKECYFNWQKGRFQDERVTVKCNYCGKDIIRKASEIKDNKHYFCSRDCHYKWKQEKGRESRKSVVCETCGKEFDKSLAEIRRSKHNFCSKECQYGWHKRKPFEGPRDSTTTAERVTVKCNYCGKDIIRKASEIKDNKHYFCNIKCRAMWLPENSRGENNPNWSRRKIKCDWCGKGFERKESAICDHNFCSKECWNKWFPKNIRGEKHHAWKPKIETKCNWCGKKIECFPGKMKNFKHHFCSNACRMKWMVVHRGETSFPTKPEKRVIKIIEKYNLPFRYVGNGSFKIGAFNPDFVNNNGEKQVIEVFGRYWHDPSYYKEINRNIQGYGLARNRKKIFRKSGYKTLILWDDEMKESSDEYIATKIQGFASSS